LAEAGRSGPLTPSHAPSLASRCRSRCRHGRAAATLCAASLCYATATLMVLHRDAVAHHIFEHVGLSLAVSRYRLAINDAVAVDATLPHCLHAHVLALAPEHVSP